MEPVLKWAGGKRLLLKDILKYIDFLELENKKAHYFEPFIGGGAVCFYSEYLYAIINDYNPEIINLYNVIKKHPSELIKVLKEYEKKFITSPGFYYEIRSLDRDSEGFAKMSPVIKAARTLFLNKTCYNGLYRVNKKGQFNVPIGRYKKLNIVNEDRINSLSNYLNKKGVVIRCGDFEVAVKDAIRGDLIYFDPPYDFEPSGFTTYNAGGFDKKDTYRLKKLCDKLVKKGCTVIVSNNDTKYINELFSNDYYKIYHIEAHRFINSNGSHRNRAAEVIIYGKQ